MPEVIKHHKSKKESGNTLDKKSIFLVLGSLALLALSFACATLPSVFPLESIKPQLYLGAILISSIATLLVVFSNQVLLDPFEDKQNRKIMYALLILILAIGLGIRLYNNTVLPYGIDNDEYIGSDIARFLSSDVVDGFWKNIGGYNLVHIFVVAPFSLLLGNTLFAIRAASGLYATFAALFVFLICARLKYPTLGIFTSGFLMFSAPFLATSRMDSVLNFAVFPFGALYFVILACEAKSWYKTIIYFGATLALTYIAINLYYVFFTIPIVLGLVAAKYLVFSNALWVQKLLIFCGLAAIIVISFPRMQQVTNMKYASTMESISAPMFDNTKLAWGADRVLNNTFTRGTYSGDDIYFNTSGPYFGTILTSLFLVGIGVVALFRSLGFYFTLLLLLPLVPAIISSHTLPRVYHLSGYGFVFFAAVPICLIIYLLTPYLLRQKIWPRVLFLGIVILLMGAFYVVSVRSYFISPPAIRASGDGLKDREVYEMVRETVSNNKYVFIVYSKTGRNHFNAYIRRNHLKFAQSYNLFEKMEKRVYEYTMEDFYGGKVKFSRSNADVYVEKTEFPENATLIALLKKCASPKNITEGEYFLKVRLTGVKSPCAELN